MTYIHAHGKLVSTKSNFLSGKGLLLHHRDSIVDLDLGQGKSLGVPANVVGGVQARRQGDNITIAHSPSPVQANPIGVGGSIRLLKGVVLKGSGVQPKRSKNTVRLQL
jgi:hypothetical protein